MAQSWLVLTQPLTTHASQGDGGREKTETLASRRAEREERRRTSCAYAATTQRAARLRVTTRPLSEYVLTHNILGGRLRSPTPSAETPVTPLLRKALVAVW